MNITSYKSFMSPVWAAALPSDGKRAVHLLKKTLVEGLKDITVLTSSSCLVLYPPWVLSWLFSLPIIDSGIFPPADWTGITLLLSGENIFPTFTLSITGSYHLCGSTQSEWDLNDIKYIEIIFKKCCPIESSWRLIPKHASIFFEHVKVKDAF